MALFLFVLTFLIVLSFEILTSAVDEIRTMWAVSVATDPIKRLPPLAAFADIAHCAFSLTKYRLYRVASPKRSVAVSQTSSTS